MHVHYEHIGHFFRLTIFGRRPASFWNRPLHLTALKHLLHKKPILLRIQQVLYLFSDVGDVTNMTVHIKSAVNLASLNESLVFLLYS